MEGKMSETPTLKSPEKTPEQKKFDEAYDRMYEEWMDNPDGEDDLEDGEDEEDSSLLMVSSLLERQVCEDGQKVCATCGKKVHTVLDHENPNKCVAKVHSEFKELFEYRIAVGKKCLELFGMD